MRDVFSFISCLSPPTNSWDSCAHTSTPAHERTCARALHGQHLTWSRGRCFLHSQHLTRTRGRCFLRFDDNVLNRPTLSPHQRFLADVYNRVGEHTNHWPMVVADGRDARPRIVFVVTNVDPADLNESVRVAEAFGREQSVTPHHMYAFTFSLRKKTPFFCSGICLSCCFFL